MKKFKTDSHVFEALRQKAEQKLSKRQSIKTTSLTEADTLKLIHELEVYHIELEMQNDELKEAKEKARVALEKYTSFYEFAHTGYFTVLPNGNISELNLTAAKMLGMEPSKVRNQSLSDFVTLDYKADYANFIKNIFASDLGSTAELRLTSKGNPSVFVRLEGRANQDKQKCLVVVIDDTKRKRIEDVLSMKLKENEQYDNLLKISNQHISNLKEEISQLMVKPREKRSLMS